MIAADKKLNNEKDFNKVGENITEIMKLTNKANVKVEFLNKVLDNVYPLITSKDFDVLIAFDSLFLSIGSRWSVRN